MAVDSKYLQFSEVQVVQNSNTVIPDPRSGHRVIVDAGGGYLYSVGGYNPDLSDRLNDSDTHYPLFKELWRFNFARRQWTKLKCRGQMPDALASHTALLHGNYMVLFGGTGVPFGEAASNELYVCNLLTLEWTHIVCSGQKPICLYGHTLTLVDRSLYLFGGTTGWEYNADLHKLDLETCTWTEVVVTGQCPAGRYRHEVACHNNELFVLGGGRSNVVYSFDVLPAINLSTCVWSTCTCSADPVCGLFPAARRCHSCVQLGSDLYLCGGYNGVEIFSDLWRLNLDTCQWFLLPSRLPEPVYFHSATVTSTGLMFIHGGVTQIDSRRSSKLFSVWLRLPTLRDLCWQTLLTSVNNLSDNTRQCLIDCGVPSDLVERLE